MRIRQVLRAISFAACAALMFGFPSTAVLGQTYQGNVTGVITDSTGAAIAGAQIELSESATGLKLSAATDQSGRYQFLQVPVGGYSLRVTRAGFATQLVPALQVGVAQEVRVNLQLRVGQQSVSVEVKSTPGLVQTDSATVNTVIQQRDIVDLPMNGRDYTQLAALAPGVTYGGTNNWGHFASIDGGREEKTEFLIDGGSNTETWSGGALVSPSPDAMEEINVQTNMSPAEFGRGIGYINAVTRAGTNNFHGDGYEFHRNSGLDARNYFAIQKPYLNREQFGGSLGGPIWRNRVFFYTDFERTQEDQDSVTETLVPTAAMRNGQFSSTIIDPTTGNPFSQNMIPGNRISSIAQYFQAFMPLPNTPSGLFNVNTPQPTDQNQVSVRLDKQGAKTTITGRYIYGTSIATNAFSGQIYGPANPLGNTVESIYTHNIYGDLTHAFTPRLMLDLRAGYYHNDLAETSPSDSGKNYTVDSGIGGFDSTSAGLDGFPYISIEGYGGIPGGTSLNDQTMEGIQSYAASLSWNHAQHTVKVGVQEFFEEGTSQNYLLAKGFFGFLGTFTGNAYADYLLGYPLYSDRSYPEPQWGSTNPRTHFYAEDEWQVTRRLTINAGLRIEFNPFPTPMKDGSNFDPTSGKVIVAAHNNQINFFYPESQAYYDWNPSWYVTSTEAGVPFSLVTAHGSRLNPRLGIAWRPFGGTSTVIRAGGGMFTLPLMGQISRGAAVVNPPWSVYEFKEVTSPAAWATFWPSGNDPSTFQQPMVTGIQSGFHTPYSIQWNLMIEQALPWKSTLTVGGVGNRGTHLETNVNINQPPYGPNSWSEIPYPQFSAFSQGFLSNGNSDYNSLQAQYEKHLSSGLDMRIGYSWSKNIDYTSSDLNFILDRFHMKYDRGLSDLDTGSRLVASWVYDLPLGAGGLLFSNANKVEQGIVGGWHLSGIALFQSGAPFSVLSPLDTSGFFVNGGQRADKTCSGKLSNPTPNHWFNTSCFQQAAAYTIGDSGRNILRADGNKNVDMGLLKNIQFTDNQSRFLQLRVEAFNVFNTPVFNAPYNVIGEPTSAVVTAANPARELQLGAKFFF